MAVRQLNKWTNSVDYLTNHREDNGDLRPGFPHPNLQIKKKLCRYRGSLTSGKNKQNIPIKNKNQSQPLYSTSVQHEILLTYLIIHIKFSIKCDIFILAFDSFV